jgi:tRNA (guanine26-N2/guanine27-N2)-dimethyltransferase
MSCCLSCSNWCANALLRLQANPDRFPAHVKLTGMLTCVTEELPETPLYYTLSGLARTLKVESPKMEKLRNALVNAGYHVSGTHCNPAGVKTDAPPEVACLHLVVGLIHFQSELLV